MSFLLRGCTLVCLAFVTNPKSIFSYIIWSGITVEGMLLNVSLDGYYAKNLPKEVRGVLVSLMGFASFLGKAIIIKVGGDLFDKRGRNAPFLLISGCDFMYVIFLLIMILLGFYGNIKLK